MLRRYLGDFIGQTWVPRCELHYHVPPFFSRSSKRTHQSSSSLCLKTISNLIHARSHFLCYCSCVSSREGVEKPCVGYSQLHQAVSSAALHLPIWVQDAEATKSVE